MSYLDPHPAEAAGPPDPLDPPESQWSLARDLYASGQTGQAVCAALGVRPSTFWRRAANEGWLRRDQPNAFYTPGPLDLDAPVDDHDAALDKAWRRVCGALDDGRSAEATRWIRVHSALLAQVEARRDSARRDSRLQLDTAFRTAKSAHDLARRLDRLEKVESTPADSHAPALLDPDAPGLSRAERRRRRKYLARSRPEPRLTPVDGAR